MKKELKLGIFVVVVFCIFAYFVIKTDSLVSLLSRGKSYPIYARFSTASGLFGSAPVRLAGVRIGLVEKIYLEGDKAVVKLLIENQHTLNSDARASIATIGIVGESYIEIVYRKDNQTLNPHTLKPGDEILTEEAFGLDAIADEFKNMAPKVKNVLDSINDIVGDKGAQDSIKGTLANLEAISANLKAMSADNGKAGKTLTEINDTIARLKKTLDSIDGFVNNLDASLFKKDKGAMHDLETTVKQIRTISGDLQKIVQDIQQGKGTAGKLLTDEALYKKLDHSIGSAKALLGDLEKKKESLDKTTLDYYAGLDYLTQSEKARFSFGLNLNFSHFSLFSRVRENGHDGDAEFTLMAGKRYDYFTVAAGMVDSGMGAALAVNLFNRKINLQVEGSRFYREDSPVMKAVLSFSLSKNISLSAGYDDLLRKESRRFMVGVTFQN